MNRLLVVFAPTTPGRCAGIWTGSGARVSAAVSCKTREDAEKNRLQKDMIQ